MEKLDVLVSVIVPVYNSETTINRCIDSVLRQSYKNIELIIINDGSSDNSLELINQYTDNRIKLINQVNSGVSIARNNGIKSALGDFLVFLDSDDEIVENCIEKLLNKILNSNLDMVVCGYNLYDIDLIMSKKSSNDELKFTKEQLKLELEKNSTFSLFAIPWCKIFKKDIIMNNDILFDSSLSLGEDSCFVLDYLKHCKMVKIIPDCLYNIYQNDLSLSKKDRRDIWENQIIIYQKYLEFIGNKDYANNFLIRCMAISVNTSIYHKWPNKDYIQLCKKMVKYQDFKNIKLHNLISLKNKIFYILLKCKMFNIIRLTLNNKK